MKIDSSGSVGTQIHGAKESEQPKHADNTKGVDSQNGAKNLSDMVTLTDAAARLQRLEQALNASPIVNDHRVEQLQKVVNDGEIRTDTYQIAAKMLNFETALNNARNGI